MPINYRNVLYLQLVSRHGTEADRHLFRCLFSHVDFSGDGKSSGKDFHQVILNCVDLLGEIYLQY